MNIFPPPLRPPGAAAEEDFLRLCAHCGKCVAICPHQSLKMTAGFSRARRSPFVEAEEIPCYLCMKCPPVCPTGALDPEITDMEKAGMGLAHILKNLCHNFIDSTMCMTCYDRCPLRGKAITLVNGLVPAIAENCVGCGVCAYVCPQKAIVIVPASSRHIPENSAPMAKKG